MSRETTYRQYNFKLFTCNFKVTLLHLFFIIISLATGPLSVCVTINFSQIPCTELLLFYFSNENGIILSNCLLINFVSLTLHAQASIYFILIVIKDFFTSVRSQLCYFFTLVFKTVLIRQKSLISFFRFFSSTIKCCFGFSNCSA